MITCGSSAPPPLQADPAHAVTSVGSGSSAVDAEEEKRLVQQWHTWDGTGEAPARRREHRSRYGRGDVQTSVDFFLLFGFFFSEKCYYSYLREGPSSFPDFRSSPSSPSFVRCYMN
jgi:hypothetical protein